MAEMKDLIAGKIDQINEAISIGEAANFKQYSKNFTAILLVGMGGSGIGGRIVSQLFKDELEIPFLTHHGYGVPNFVNENTLVIASSYSGNTEETINAVLEIEQRGAEIIVISSGGSLLEMARLKNWNYFQVPGGEQPRAMLAYSIIQQVYALTYAGFISEFAVKSLMLLPDLINESEDALRMAARTVAEKCLNKTPIIYAGEQFEGVATRFRQQLNENAKVLCWHHVLPELTHNELVGWAGGSNEYNVIYLDSSLNHEKTQIRWGFVKEKIQSLADSVMSIEAKGRDLITQTFYLIHFTDWVSYYLSELRQVDPNEVNVIQDLKNHIGE